MATRRGVVNQQQPPLTPEQQEALDREIEEQENRDRLIRSLDDDAEKELSLEDELGAIAGSKIRVSRVSSTTRGAPGGYCFTCDAGEYRLDQLIERIRDDWGGGKYRLRVYDNKGLRMNREIDVLEANKKGEAVAAPVVQAEPQTDKLAALLVAMQENSRQMMDAMYQSQMKQSENNQTMLLGIIQSMNSRPAQDGMSIGDALALAKALAPPSVDPMEKFLQGVQFGKEMGEAGGDSSPLLSLAKDAIGPLVELSKLSAMQNAGGPPRISAPPMLSAPVATAVQAAEKPVGDSAAEIQSTETSDQESHNMNLAALAQWQPVLNMCYVAAQQDADPEVYANLILDQVGGENAGALLADPANYEKLFTFVPVLVPYRQWFDDLKETVLELLRQESGEEGEGGNVLGEPGSAPVSGGLLPGGEQNDDNADA